MGTVQWRFPILFPYQLGEPVAQSEQNRAVLLDLIWYYPIRGLSSEISHIPLLDLPAFDTDGYSYWT